MKRRFIIGLFVLLALAACHRPVETQNFASLPSTTSPKLSAIDSLMWQRPDSALACLLPCFDTCCAAEHDRHYAHLFLSELLYKNDYAQTNRAELQDAVVYFDSLMQAPEPVEGPSKKQNIFLAARAHYINGVGYYEQDSAVPACQEYLKALETMEEGFEERELVGEKARFMALTYTRLSDLFSNYYLHEQTIVFSRLSLFYYQKQETPSWFVARMLCEIGSHYDMMKQLDSAEYYYNKASDALSDTSVLMYRDISALIAFLSYKKNGNGMFAINELERLLSKAENENEYLARCAVIGEIFYHENLLDSALFYLNTVFHNSSNENLKRQDAKLLVEVLKVQGRHSEIHEYAEFLAPFATLEEDKSTIKSQLEEAYHNYWNQIQVERNRQKIKKQIIGSTIVLSSLIVMMSGFFVLYRRNKRKKQSLEAQIKEEQYAHKMKQRALSGRLKHSNSALKELKTAQTFNAMVQEKPEEDLGRFSDEDICQHILAICNDKTNPIKSTVSVSSYANIALDNAQKAQLKQAVLKHYGGLFNKLKKQYPSLKEKDLLYCYFCLLGLDNVQIAALLQHSSSTIWEREKRLQSIFESDDKVGIILQDFITN